MKVFLALLTYVALSTSHAASIDDLNFKCQGVWKITEVGDAKFTPALPAQGRHSGFPSHGSVNVTLEITSFQNVECSILKTKYGAELKGPIQAQVHFSNPHDLKAVQWLAETLKDKVLTFQNHQDFGYVWNKAYLPLFPDIVEEHLYLNSKTQDFVLSVPIKFSVQQVYGVIPVDNWEEDKKMKLVEHLANLLDLNAALGLSQFHELYLGLNLDSVGNQRKFFLFTWKAFQEAALKPNNQFFNFNVGGVGAFVGDPFAQKITALANLAAYQNEKIELLNSFPSLLRATHFLVHECLNVNATDFHQVLEKWHDQYDGLLDEKKSDIHEMLSAFVNPVNSITNNCLLPLQTPENLELSQIILDMSPH